MDTNNKNMWMWVGGVVVLVVVAGLLVWSMNKDLIATPEDNNTVGNNTVDNLPVVNPGDIALEPNLGTEDISEGSVNVSSPAVTIGYADALKKYADKRIQFDTICQAHPNTVTYKDNTGIMLDNRSPVARIIKVGTNYTVKAWGFKIIVLPDIYLKAKTLLVDCDKSQNVATILVQE